MNGLGASDLAAMDTAQVAELTRPERESKKAVSLRLAMASLDYYQALADARGQSLSELIRDVLKLVQDIGLDELKPSVAVLATMAKDLEAIKLLVAGSPAVPASPMSPGVTPGPGGQALQEESLPEELKLLLAIGRDVIKCIIRDPQGQPAKTKQGIIRCSSNMYRTQLIEKLLSLSTGKH